MFTLYKSLKLFVVVHRYFVVCLVGVWQRNFEPVVCACVCVCVCTVRPAVFCSFSCVGGNGTGVLRIA